MVRQGPLGFVVVTISLIFVWAAYGRGFWPRRLQHAIFGDALIDDMHDIRGRRNIRVCFFGDSLIAKTDMDHNLLDDVCDDLNEKDSLADLHFIPIEGGVFGNRIADLRRRLTADCLDHNPEAAILYWDSDASDIPAANDTNATRLAYRQNLDFVLAEMTAAMPGKVAMGGPTLIGEQPRGQNWRDKRYDEPGGYVDMNRRAAKRYGVPYLETRQAFWDALPSNYTPTDDCISGSDLCMGLGFFGLNCCYLTEDGEHHSQRGTFIIRKMFVSVLSSFYEKKGSIGGTETTQMIV